MIWHTRNFAALAVLLFVFPPSGSARVSPEEAADGWISLFDGATLFGWNQIGDARWEVDQGRMICREGSGGWIATTSRFMDFELEVRMRIASGKSSGLLVRASSDGHPGENGTTIVPLAAGEGEVRRLKITAEGDSVQVTLDGLPVSAAPGQNPTGFIGFQYHRRGDEIEVESVRLRPLPMRSLFNGVDLSGWRILPGRRSRFSVENGHLRIRDGNGQIETVELFRNFILQLDVLSHGKHLNSGVFFRGVPGEFWRGYESQIRNQWQDDDRTRPVDYGTGGNYGNQPARRVVSNDHEWFTKTIVCAENHMAIWVDGTLVSDFTDTRPAAADHAGKRGYLAGPGTIHLQGHDPSTDLSFKNIRIQDYSPVR